MLDDSQSLESLKEADGVVTLTFSKTSPVLAALDAEDVLIVGVTHATPKGALLAIDELSDDGLIVRAHRASLGQAFEKLDVHVETSLSLGTSTNATSQSVSGSESLGRVRQAVGVSFPFSAGDDSLSLEGSLALDPEVKLKLDIDFAELELDELSLSLSASETFVANLTARGGASVDETFHIADIALEPIILTVPVPGLGVVPIVLTPGISLDGGVRGRAEGEVDAAVTQQASFTAGLGYVDGEFQAFSDDDTDFDFDDPTFAASASVRAWAGPKLEVLVYGAVGPFAGVQGFLEASASVEGVPPCLTGALDAGLSATAGVSFIADYSTTLFEERYRLAGFDSCDAELASKDAATSWARTYDRTGSDGERAQAVLQVSDGGYFLLGESSLFEGVKGFAASAWALRLDSLGNVIWQRAFLRSEQGLTRAAAEVPGGFLVAGDTGLLKLDSGGNLRWAKSYASEEGLSITSIAADADGNVVLAGVLGLSGRAVAIGLDPRGDVTWARRFAGTDFRRVRTTADGGYLLAGSTAGAESDLYVVKLSADGSVVWQRRVDNRYDAQMGVEDAQPTLLSGSESAYDALERPDGGVVIVGESYGNFPVPEAASGGYYANLVVELSAAGELETCSVSRSPKNALYGAAYGALVRPNGSTLVVARGAAEVGDLLTNEDVLLISGGSFRALGGAGNDYVYSGTLPGLGRGMPLQLTNDGGAILAVTSNSFAGSDQIWLLKLSRTGNIDSPYRRNVEGASYDNPKASTMPLELDPTDVDIEVATFTAEMKSEVTPSSSAQQSR